jgi:Bacterial Ig-like domain (group 3)
MAFRYFVRCLALAAVALVAMGCSSSAFPAPSPAGTRPAGSVQGPQPVGSAGAAARLTATGTVTVRSGGKVICVMTIKNGKGTCTVSAKNYKPGTVSFTGAYSGGNGMKASTSKPLSVRLQKAPKAK